MVFGGKEFMRRIRHDLIDTYDEELETKLEGRTVAEIVGDESSGHTAQEKEICRQYFGEQSRLQVEPVRLQG